MTGLRLGGVSVLVGWFGALNGFVRCVGVWADAGGMLKAEVGMVRGGGLG